MNKLNLTRIHTLPSSLKFGLIIITIFFSCIVGYFFYLKSFVIKKYEIYAELKNLKIKLNKQNKVSAHRYFYRQEISDIKNKFNLYVNSYKNNSFISLMNKMLSQGININAINIIEINKKEFLTEILVKISLIAPNDNILDIIKQIANSEYLFILEKFSWKFFNTELRNVDQKKRLVLLFRIYYYGADSAKFTLKIAKFKKLHAKNFTQFKPNILVNYYLHDLKMVGFLVNNWSEQRWGLIKAPNTQIYKVELGDCIGLEQGLVIAINFKKILILINNFKKIIELPIESTEFKYASILSH